MIPSKLHHVWVGPRELPGDWLGVWRGMHPGWEQKVWREEDIESLEMRGSLASAYLQYQKDGNWVGMSDVARYAILHREGGVYVDVDSKPLRTFEGAPFMGSTFFAAYEPVPSLPGRVANGCIGAEPGHHLFVTLADLIGGMRTLEPVWDTVGGTALTAAILVHRQCCQPLVLPARTFYSLDAGGRPTPGREEPYSTHFWASTNKAYKARAAILVPRRADGGRRDELWEFVRRDWGRLGVPIVEGHDEGDHPFSAALARNRAAQEAGDWEVAVFVDADTVMLDHSSVLRGIETAHRTGQFVRPFRRYWMTDEQGAAAVMAGERPRMHARPLRDSQIHGGVNIIPRGLWDRLGGYDERFRGWGYEDAAIELAARHLGGFAQLAGEVHHLWHPTGPDRSADSPTLLANKELFGRYERASRRRSSLLALLREKEGEPPPPLSVGCVVITNGRRELLARTLASLERQVGPFDARLISDDSGDPDFRAWLAREFPSWDVVHTAGRTGHGPAVRFALGQAARLDVDWIFWCEDDYTFPEPIDLEQVARVMVDEGPDLKQMVIKRQPWFPLEVEAGGMIERFDPKLFREREALEPGVLWIEHRQFYSLNPHLVERAFVQAIAGKWPATPNSEHEFSRRLFRDPRPRVGLWGGKSDPPRAIHDGERTGSGY